MSTFETLAFVRAQETRDDALSALSREQLEAEVERLRQREALFIATEEIARTGHYEWSFPRERLETCSEQYARIYDMTVEEVMEAHSNWEKALQLVHPEDREYYAEQIEAFHHSRSLDAEYRIELEDGTVKHLREMCVATAGGQDDSMRAFGVLQDITQRIQHERDMEYREELARHAESITDIGHFIYDEEDQRYLYLSEGFARIHGTEVDEYMSRMQTFEDDLSDIVDEDRDRVADEYRYFRESGHDCAIEYRIRRVDGAIRWLRELGIAKEMKSGRVSKTLGVVQDITERVNHEQELTFRGALAYQAETLTDIGYFLFDEKENRHIFASMGQSRIVGIGMEKLATQSNEDYLQMIHPEDREMVREAYSSALAENRDWNVAYRIIRPDGELRWIREVGRAHKVTAEGIEQTIGVIQDITEQKNTEQELLDKDALATQAEAITDIGHFIYDEIKQAYLFVSPGLAHIHGCEENAFRDRVLGQERDLDLIHPEDRNKVQKVYDEFIAGGETWQVDFRLVRDDGAIRWVREMGKAHVIGHGMPEQTIGVLQDITDQKNAEQEIIRAKETLEQQVVARTRELANTVKQLQEEVEEREKIAAELDFLANHDALTGLPSLRLCKDRLEHSLAEARRNRQMSAVMFLDLDGFKEVNDSHGHEFGDKVLKATAERIKGEIRETDTVARIGGDEFVIILSSLPRVRIAERIAASIIEQVSQVIEIDGVSVTVSTSIGISLYPEHGITPEEMIREADRAMYRIKDQGKNSFGFAHSINL